MIEVALFGLVVVAGWAGPVYFAWKVLKWVFTPKQHAKLS